MKLWLQYLEIFVVKLHLDKAAHCTHMVQLSLISLNKCLCRNIIKQFGVYFFTLFTFLTPIPNTQGVPHELINHLDVVTACMERRAFTLTMQRPHGPTHELLIWRVLLHIQVGKYLHFAALFPQTLYLWCDLQVSRFLWNSHTPHTACVSFSGWKQGV